MERIAGRARESNGPLVERAEIAPGGRGGCRAERYFRLVRNWFRWVVQSEPPVWFVAQLPCHPQTHVIVCSRCLYWSMT